MQPVAISLPYTHQLMLLGHHCTGSPALDRLSSAACHPCYPGRRHPPLPFSQRVSTGLPQLTRGSASPIRVTRLPVGSLSLRPASLPFGNLRPLIAQTPLPRATQAYGQLLGRDFNPQDKRLLLQCFDCTIHRDRLQAGQGHKMKVGDPFPPILYPKIFCFRSEI